MKFFRAGICAAGVICFTSSVAQAAVIPLTNDSGRTDTAAFGTTKEGPLNDLFAYDPLNPGSALPVQSYQISPPDLWHSPNGINNTKYAVQFDASYTDIFIDFYARSDQSGVGEYGRDDNLTVKFFNGGWNAGDAVHTETGWMIDNVVAGSNRLTIPAVIEADRFEIINNSAINWSIAELRANGVAVPEPASLILLSLGELGLLVRRGRRRRR